MSNDQQEPPVDLDLTGPDFPVSLEYYVRPPTPFDPEKHKATSATTVARVILATFAATIVLPVIASLTIFVMAKSADDAKRFTDILVALLESVSKFSTTVFGPLLAFILGYYFSQRNKDA